MELCSDDKNQITAANVKEQHLKSGTQTVLLSTASGLSRWGVLRQEGAASVHASLVTCSMVPIKTYVHVNTASPHPSKEEKSVNGLRKQVNHDMDIDCEEQ